MKKDHKHHHQHPGSQRPHPLTQFFGCCLGDEPAPISPKIQNLRESLGEPASIEEVKIVPGERFCITKDMIVADILSNFPQTKDYLTDLHPLGVLSPALDTISLEMFFSDIEHDPEKICNDLNAIVNLKNQND